MSCKTLSKLAAFLVNAVLALAIVVVPAARAQTFTVLHTFSGTDGIAPWGHLVLDGGRLTGATADGGILGCTVDGIGCGTVFTMDATGNETVLYSFDANGDGENPFGGVVTDGKGHFYGTTLLSGTVGFGSVFEVDYRGDFRVLYSFTYGSDGGHPTSGLLRDPTGNLYGTTQDGANGFGTVFKIDPNGNETTLYTFNRGTDGGVPRGGLIRDGLGNLYGTTLEGGNLSCGLQSFGCGVVFRLDTAGNLQVLHTFLGGKDGSAPGANLMAGADGSLYGNTINGGGGNCTSGPYDNGCGVIFKIARNGRYSILYRFTGGADGAFPDTALVHDGSGNLFGVAPDGGPTCSFPLGCGTVFKLAPNGIFTVLHGFTDVPDGEAPRGLTISSTGVLYGTAAGGGSGDGVVYKVVQ
ncbi:MAG: choice-of-anchor tandem repeat GloVer-containing protein [Candidatus Sulfotelmatobacter sp.]